METARVDIVYRPLRVGFALSSSDRASFRKVVRMCSAFWGGRYNPILAVDRPEAARLVEVFRPDFLVQIGDDPATAAFVANFPYLINPLISEEMFFPAWRGREGGARLLDIENLIVHRRETAEWRRFLKDGLRVPSWAPDDPLADVFLAQFGGFPDPTEVGVDYGRILSQVTREAEIPIAPDGSVPPEVLDHRGISHLGRFGLEPHYTSNANWIHPGLYAGDANDGADLVNFWNLRACGMGLLFLDSAHWGRTAELHARYIERLRAQLPGREEFDRQPAVWSRDDASEQAREAGLEGDILFCRLGEEAGTASTFAHSVCISARSHRSASWVEARLAHGYGLRSRNGPFRATYGSISSTWSPRYR